jgi:hypothetical protein
MQRRSTRPIYLLYLAFALLALTGLLALVLNSPQGCFTFPPGGPCTRVLFIGNSYTYVNDLPTTFAKLARSGGHKVATGMAASGGWTLVKHVQSKDTLDKLNSQPWDFIVLQEQSEIPAFEFTRTNDMYPAARELVSRVREANATPVFYLTFGHRDGMPDQQLPDYAAMQAELDAGYGRIAQELGVLIAPAGDAWYAALQADPQLDLWQNDGSHPNPQGTYLTACVFYATIFNESPEGLSYSAGLPKETAQAMQSIAARVVFVNP